MTGLTNRQLLALVVVLAGASALASLVVFAGSVFGGNPAFAETRALDGRVTAVEHRLAALRATTTAPDVGTRGIATRLETLATRLGARVAELRSELAHQSERLGQVQRGVDRLEEAGAVHDQTLRQGVVELAEGLRRLDALQQEIREVVGQVRGILPIGAATSAGTGETGK